ncbi:MAG: TIGR03915 family putative DNA repair protein [Clostridia bacterium]|nr:TIGR03915 family putative DNA repair protein [Clostridia bacterium]
MSKRSTVIFVIDGSFEGLLSALFYGFSHRLEPADVVEETYQTDLFHQTLQIPTREDWAKRVARGLVNKGGYACYRQIYLAFLCEHEIRYHAIYEYAAMVLREGGRARYAIATEAGARVLQLSRFAANEAHLLVEFVRFSVLEDGVMFARMAPKSDCLELVLDHFAKRFSGQRFLLCDTVHYKAGVFQPPGQKMIVPVDRIPNPEPGEEERKYRELWKQFFHSVAIADRYNPRCQNSHLPKRYRLYMTEFLSR